MTNSPLIKTRKFQPQRSTESLGHGGYPLSYFDDLASETVAKRWLIKGIMARGETSAWIAPPGGMKSALLAQASICVAGGMDWHEKKNKGAAGVVYLA